MTGSAFVAPRASNKRSWLYRVRPAVAHEGFVSFLLPLVIQYLTFTNSDRFTG